MRNLVLKLMSFFMANLDDLPSDLTSKFSEALSVKEREFISENSREIEDIESLWED